MLKNETASKKPVDQPLINEEADRELGRIIILHGGIFVVLALLVSGGMSFLNVPQNPMFHIRRFLDTLSVLVIMAPFFLGVSRANAIRLKWGRRLIAEGQWTQAIGALETFNTLGQHFLDGSGEAHYLLAQALERAGRPAEAEKVRKYLRKNRPSSQWTAQLQKNEERSTPRISQIKRLSATKEGSRPTASKSSRRRN